MSSSEGDMVLINEKSFLVDLEKDVDIIEKTIDQEINRLNKSEKEMFEEDAEKIKKIIYSIVNKINKRYDIDDATHIQSGSFDD